VIAALGSPVLDQPDEVTRCVRPARRHRPGLDVPLEVVRGRLVDPGPRLVAVFFGDHRGGRSARRSRRRMVDGEYPDCSSHRSTPNEGPWETRKSAAGLMWLRHSEPLPSSPACSAMMIG